MVHALLVVLALQPLAQVPEPPPVRIWIGSAPSATSEDPGRVFVQTTTDGHLVLLHARADGRVEVLFPADPARDPFVVAGTYEIPLASAGSDGRGMVVAALSPDPIWFDEFVHRSMWDVAALTGAGAGGDPEAALTDVVQRMLGDGSFSYDVATYSVAAPVPTVYVAPSAFPVPTVTVMPDPGVYEAGACLGCFYPWVDAAILGLPFPRHSGHRRWNSRPVPWPRTTFPDPPAMAAYSAHQPNALAPVTMRQRQVARPSQFGMPTSRRRTPPTTAATAPRTVTTRAAPLVARSRSTTAAATAATRSQLLVRYVRTPRNPSAGLAPTNAIPRPTNTTVAARAFTGSRPAMSVVARPAAPAGRPMAPGTRFMARPEGWRMSVQGGVAVVPAPAVRSGSATAVGLDGVRTAGWRHR